MSNIDKYLLESLENKEMIKQRVQEHFTDSQIKTIMENVLDGQINRYLVMKANEIVVDKIDNMINAELDKILNDEKVIEQIKFQCKTFVYSKDYLQRIMIYFDDKFREFSGFHVEGYMMFQLVEKFIKEVKEAHEDEMRMRQ